MKRRLRIGVRPRQRSYSAALQAFRQAEAGRHAGRSGGLYFESMDDVRRILTARRLDLLVAILQRRPASVTELARVVKRDLKNVSEDLAVLQQLGVVEFAPSRTHGNARTPVVPYDEIEVTIDLKTLAVRKAA
jgi:predicted transcriptional regulator